MITTHSEVVDLKCPSATGFGMIPEPSYASGPHYGILLGGPALAVFMFFAPGTGGSTKNLMLSHDVLRRTSVHVEAKSNALTGVGNKAEEAISTPERIVGNKAEEAISTPERITQIRKHLSMNIKQLSDALCVGRPTLYHWINEETTPRTTQLNRLKSLYDVARYWIGFSNRPVGKHLVTPLQDGRSLAALLSDPYLDLVKVQAALQTIHSVLEVSDQRKLRSNYRSAASIMRERGYEPDDSATQELRIAQESQRLNLQG
jgi:DNA-binding transcriptional regulator YiaG